MNTSANNSIENTIKNKRNANMNLIHKILVNLHLIYSNKPYFAFTLTFKIQLININ